MKQYLRHTLAASAALLALTACTSEMEYTEGEPEDPNCAGIYFLGSGKNLEIEPGSKDTLHVTLCRSNTQGDINVPIVVTTNEDDNYIVPSQVSFADGESNATLVVDFSRMEAGTTKKLALTVDPQYISKYGNVNTRYDFYTSISLIKWETMVEDESGEAMPAFWLDGLISSVFTTQAQLPMAVEAQRAQLPSGEVRFRFTSPYSDICEYVLPLDGTTDNVAYIGYPYNGEGDLNGKATPAVISVKNGKASLAPFVLGNDFGYGGFMAGTILGNLYSSGSLITDESAYPLGRVDTTRVVRDEATGDTLNVYFTITFPERSLYIDLPDYSIFPCSQPSYFTNDPQVVLDIFYNDAEEKPEPEPYVPTWSKLYTGTYIHAAHVLNTKGEYNPTGTPFLTFAPNFVLSKDWSVYVQDPIPGEEDPEDQLFRIQPWITDDGILEFTWNADNTLTVTEAYTGVETDDDGRIMAQDMVSAKVKKCISYYDAKKQTFVFNLYWYGEKNKRKYLGLTEDLFVLDLSREAIKRRAKRQPMPYTPVPMSRELRTDLPQSTLSLLHPFDF